MPESTQRLFFALSPTGPVADALAMLAQEVAAESCGRATAPGNVHLTLAFLGEQPARVARALSVAAARVSVPAFELVFDRLGSWRKSEVAWAGVRSVPPQLSLLHESIGGVLRDNGLTPDERPLAVHVTLARRISIAVKRPLTMPLTWQVSEFALVASDLSAAAPRYRVLSRWPLDAG